MKIIINENKLEKVVGKWLNSEYGDLDVYDHNYEPWVFYVDDEGDIRFLYQYDINKLYVDNNIIEFFLNIFSIDEEEIYLIIKNWFEEYAGLNIYKVVSWDFTTASIWKDLVKRETKKRLGN